MQVDLVLEVTIPPIGESIGVILQMVVTEGGSSGSPIYNQDGLIVGDLTEVHHIVMQPINLMYTENFGMVGIKWVIVILSN